MHQDETIINYTWLDSITFLFFVQFLWIFYQNIGLYIFFQKKGMVLGKKGMAQNKMAWRQNKSAWRGTMLKQAGGNTKTG